jgi:hypothetical protein
LEEGRPLPSLFFYVTHAKEWSGYGYLHFLKEVSPFRGTDLLKWTLYMARQLGCREFHLFDDATVSCNRSSKTRRFANVIEFPISLLVLRKIQKGQTWYEKNGFRLCSSQKDRQGPYYYPWKREETIGNSALASRWKNFERPLRVPPTSSRRCASFCVPRRVSSTPVNWRRSGPPSLHISNSIYRKDGTPMNWGPSSLGCTRRTASSIMRGKTSGFLSKTLRSTLEVRHYPPSRRTFRPWRPLFGCRRPFDLCAISGPTPRNRARLRSHPSQTLSGAMCVALKHRNRKHKSLAPVSQKFWHGL